MGVLIAAVASEDFLLDVKGYLAWSVVLVSIGSLVLHRVLGVWAGPKTEESRLETPDGNHRFDIKSDAY